MEILQYAHAAGAAARPELVRPIIVIPEESVIRDRRSLARQVFQPGRLDVLVHLRALEFLAGPSSDRVGASDALHPAPRSSDPIDWPAVSDALSSADVEPSVRSLAVELESEKSLGHPAVFRPGGQLVAGSTAAAAAVHGGVALQCTETSRRGVDRSQDALAARGFSEAELRGAIDTWLRHDPDASLVIVDHDSPRSAEAVAELGRRYEIFFQEFDHLSPEVADAVGADRAGSAHVLFVRVNPQTIEGVVERHGEAITAWFFGYDAVGAARALHGDERPASTSVSHARALRRRRRADRRARLIAGLRALRA